MKLSKPVSQKQIMAWHKGQLIHNLLEIGAVKSVNFKKYGLHLLENTDKAFRQEYKL